MLYGPCRSAGLDHLRYRQCGQDGEGAEKFFRQRHQAHGRHRFRGILAVFGSFSAGHLITLDKNIVSCISGGVIMLVLNMIADKKNLKLLREWSLFFALFGGMLVAVVWP
jgi:hypothetical protein